MGERQTEKKLYRKLKRIQTIATKHLEVQFSDKPTDVLLIGNAGLVTGANYQQLFEIFQSSQHLLDIILIPEQPFAFVVFSSIDGATAAKNEINGAKVLKDPESGILKSIYLLFINEVPSKYKLFEAVDVFPKGLAIIKNVISETEEKELLDCIKWDKLDTSLKHRRVKHFGYEFCYDNNTVNPIQLEEKIPESCMKLLSHLYSNCQISIIPDQLTVNEYQPGQGIPPHVDTHSEFEDEILSLSLGSDIVMDFRHPDSLKYSVLLPRLSLLVMKEESRYLWSHGIIPRKTDIIKTTDCNEETKHLTLNHRGIRTSFTFRKVRKRPCTCACPEQCDTQKQNLCITNNSSIMNNVENIQAEELEKRHVHEVYELIAQHFSDTRHKPWPQVAKFVQNLSECSFLLDVGCGNGKYLNLKNHIIQIGCDMSKELLSVCTKNGHQVVCCDGLKLPFRSCSFDACICIAVIHHFATKERRFQAIAELTRILRNKGKCLVYVWAIEQESGNSYIKESKIKKAENCEKVEMSLSNCSLNLPIHTNRTKFSDQDVLVPWHLKNSENPQDALKNTQVFHRFYHVFKNGELEELCRDVPNINIIESYFDKGNWCVVFEKVSKSLINL